MKLQKKKNTKTNFDFLKVIAKNANVRVKPKRKEKNEGLSKEQLVFKMQICFRSFIRVELEIRRL